MKFSLDASTSCQLSIQVILTPQLKSSSESLSSTSSFASFFSPSFTSSGWTLQVISLYLAADSIEQCNLSDFDDVSKIIDSLRSDLSSLDITSLSR